MNICMTHFAFYPTTGGVESHLLELSSELVRQGHQVYALVGTREGSPENEMVGNVQVFRYDWMNPEKVRERKKKAGYAAAVCCPEIQTEFRRNFRAFVSAHNCDLVHAHNFHHFLPEYGLALTQLHESGLPTILTIHEVWSEFLCEDLLQNTTWDAVITVSKHVKEGIRRQAPHLTNASVIYMGIDTGLFSPEHGAKGAAQWNRKLGIGDRPMIIHPARMLPWKGVIHSIQALGKVREHFPEALLVVTDTPDIVDWVDELKGYKEEVHAEVARHKLEGNVLFQSFAYAELPAIYANASIVIYPTIGEEPFGLVPVEAMSCARPVIVTRSGGLVESVIDGKTGYVIKKRDADSLANRIVVLLRDRALAQKMGETGRQHALENFQRKRMARETAALYSAACKQHVGAR